MTLINNGRAPAKVRKDGCPWRLWGGHPAAVAVRKLPASTRFNCGPGGLREGGVRPIGNLRHLSVMLDLAAFTRHGTGNRTGQVEEVAREWRNGRRAGFRCQCPKGRGGSNPPLRTDRDRPRQASRRGRSRCTDRRDVGG